MKILHKNLRDMEVLHPFGKTKLDSNGEAEVNSEVAEYLMQAGFELVKEITNTVKLKDKLNNSKATKDLEVNNKQKKEK